MQPPILFFRGKSIPVFVAIVLMFSHRANAVELLVSNTNNSGPGSLRQAVIDNNLSAGGNTIVFSNTVTGTIRLTNGALFVLKSAAIIGPGPAALAVNGNYPQTTNAVFYVRDRATVTIANLTVTNGNFTGGSGGGIYNEGSTVTVSNCVITGSSARNGGGIINDGSLSNATLTVIASTFAGNSATYGGAIYNVANNGSATVSVINSTFIGNTAVLEPVFLVGGSGAGIYNDGRFGSDAAITLSNCTFSGNSAVESGGGIYNDGRQIGNATVLVNSSVFRSNSAALYGGGIHNDGTFTTSSGIPSLMVNNSTFSGNSAGAGGGISSTAFQGKATNAVSGCTFSGNSATYSGGGIGNEGINAIFSVNASTFSGNSADEHGGGIDNHDAATLTIADSTFSGNSANISGGGIYNENAALDIGNSILKAGTNGATITDTNGLVTSFGYNLSSDAGGGFLTNTTDQINTDPLLAPLTNNGGSTLTHALLPGSPAIDKGKSFGLTTDQRGVPRPLDFPSISNAVGGDGSDIGAFEFNRPTLDIKKAGSNVVLSWPSFLGLFTLESSTNIASSNNWITAGGSAAIVGNQYQQTNGPISSNRFFRLRGN